MPLCHHCGRKMLIRNDSHGSYYLCKCGVENRRSIQTHVPRKRYLGIHKEKLYMNRFLLQNPVAWTYPQPIPKTFNKTKKPSTKPLYRG